jgi:hypothetical protein
MAKKICITVCLLLCITVSSVFAEFEFSTWGRGVVTPLSVGGGDSSVSAASNTWDERARIGLTVKAASPEDNIGFLADLIFDGGDPAIGDNAKVWVQPVNFVKLTAGWFNEDQLRSTIGNSEFTSWLLPSGGKDEDGIFTRFQATVGAHLAITPIEGLFIGAAFGGSPGNKRALRNLTDHDAFDVYKAIHIGAGYNIPQIGFARAQFIGNNRTKLLPNDRNIPEGQKTMEGLTTNRDADVIEAAFDFTMIKGLEVDLGGKIPFQYETDTKFRVYEALNPNAPIDNSDGVTMTVQLPYTVALGLVYNPQSLPSLKILFRTDLSFGGWAEEKNGFRLDYGFNLNAWLNPSYLILPNLRTGLDIGFELHANDTYTYMKQTFPKRTEGSEHIDFGIGPWAEFLLGHGSIKTGVLVMIPSNERWIYNVGNSVKTFTLLFPAKPVITIPVSFTFSF